MRAIIAGGGTGGHLFPGIAVAREIERRCPGSEILFVGAEQGIETRLVPQEGYALRTLPSGGVKGLSWRKKVQNLAATLTGLIKARRILKEFDPSVVIGVGGYASVPMVGAAILSGYPRLIMEQNSIPGLANRMLGWWVDYAAVTDHRTARFFGARAVVTGNPVRPQFKSIPPRIHKAPFTILIFGGSQGARAINEGMRNSLPFLADWKDHLRFIHQTGEQQLEQTRSAYAQGGFTADVRAFFENFHEQYGAADLIIARAGATTVAEVKAAGRAAVLVPFPFAADDHQTKNAAAMVEENAAVMIANADLRGDQLATTIRSLLSDLNRLTEIEQNARRLAVLDAEKQIVDLAEHAIRRHGG